jgi:aldehyde:ferredoxin oxidoreductase
MKKHNKPYQHRVAQVDLSTGKTETFHTPSEIVRAYIGGRGLNMYYLARYLKPGIDAFDPQNPLIFGAGILTGHLGLSPARFNVSSKSAEALCLADANCGAFWGAQLRYAGLDCLILQEKAPGPSYLLVEPQGISLHSANDLWGLDAIEVQVALRKIYGDEIEVAAIGAAGERRVRFACILTGMKDVAARGGLGAVMGSKNLKAVVVRGNRSIPAAHPQGLIDFTVKKIEELKSTVAIEAFAAYGTPWLFNLWNMMGALRVKNSQETVAGEGLSVDNLKKYEEKALACSGCPIACRRRNKFKGEGPEFGSMGALGYNLGIEDVASVIQLNNLCNRLGLDTTSAGTIMAWVIELYQRGLLPPDLCDRPLAYGDFDLAHKLLIDIAERRGLGDLLAESTQAVKQLGPASQRYLIAGKGLPGSDPIDMRLLTSFALGEAVSSRGMDHLRNRPTVDVLGLDAEYTKKIYGVEIDPSPTDYSTKHHLIFYHENYLALVDSLGLCKFAYGLNGYDFATYEDFPRWLELVTGLSFSEEELRRVGPRICDTERLINQRLGLDGTHDTLPDRFFEEEVPSGPIQGRKLDREKFKGLLKLYYHLRGWDEKGRLKKERREELQKLMNMPLLLTVP